MSAIWISILVLILSPVIVAFLFWLGGIVVLVNGLRKRLWK